MQDATHTNTQCEGVFECVCVYRIFEHSTQARAKCVDIEHRLFAVPHDTYYYLPTQRCLDRR